jgi:hypothetical protein
MNRCAESREMPDDLFVVEEHIAIVVPEAEHRGTAKGARARIIARLQRGAIDQHPR